MSEKDDEYIEVASCLPCPITRQELGLLQDMFQSAGWKVWMRLKQIDLAKSADIALSLTASDVDRAMQRAAYHVILQDLTLQQRLTDEANNGNVVTETEAMAQREIPSYSFTVHVNR